MPGPEDYPKQYRKALGFAAKDAAMEFLGGGDVSPEIDWGYVDRLTLRAAETVRRLNAVMPASARMADIESFLSARLAEITAKREEIIPRLNNMGRRPEEVFYSWLRGRLVEEFFLPLIAHIFAVSPESVMRTGEDSIATGRAFKRSASADLQIEVRGRLVRLEIQSGYKGANDIKRHKVVEAHHMLKERGASTIVVHFDLFNGKVAFVQLDATPLEGDAWVTRSQMEGQLVFAIQEQYFRWRLLDDVPRLDDLGLSL